MFVSTFLKILQTIRKILKYYLISMHGYCNIMKMDLQAGISLHLLRLSAIQGLGDVFGEIPGDIFDDFGDKI